MSRSHQTNNFGSSPAPESYIAKPATYLPGARFILISNSILSDPCQYLGNRFISSFFVPKTCRPESSQICTPHWLWRLFGLGTKCAEMGSTSASKAISWRRQCRHSNQIACSARPRCSLGQIRSVLLTAVDREWRLLALERACQVGWDTRSTGTRLVRSEHYS
jgi:hypothetical protein